MPYHEDLTPTLAALVDLALDECVKAKKATDFRFPMMLLTGPSEKSITVLANDAATAVATARTEIRAKTATVEAYVIAYDGSVKARDGRDLDAFILEAGERLQAQSFVFYQRYRRDDDGALVLVFGSSGFLRRTEQLLK